MLFKPISKACLLLVLLTSISPVLNQVLENESPTVVRLSGVYQFLNRSNMYIPLSLTTRLFSLHPPAGTVEDPMCPSSLSLNVYESGQDLKLDFPGGLYDPSDSCPSETVTLIDSTKLIRYGEQDFFIASIPPDLIQCYGMTDTPFSSIQLSSLKEDVLSELKAIFYELAIPNSVLEHITSNVTTPLPELSLLRSTIDALPDERVLKLHCTMGVVEAASPPKAIDPFDELHISKNVHHGHHAGSCAYLLSRDHALLSVGLERVAIALAPIAARARLVRNPLPSLTMYKILECSTQDGVVGRVSELSLRLVPTLIRSPGWYSVSVNGATCASTHVYSGLESGDNTHATKSARELADLLARRVAPQARGTHPKLLHALIEAVTYTSVHVARIDVERCLAIDDKRPLHAFIVHRPASFFFCLASADMAIEACEQAKQIQDDAYVGLLAHNGPPQCFFSQSRRLAEWFQSEGSAFRGTQYTQMLITESTPTK